MKHFSLSFLVLTLFLAGGNSAQVRQQPEVKSVPGRYQIVINPEYRADVFLLDTETGRTWVRTEITNLDGHPSIWMPKDRIDCDEQFTEWSNKKVALQNLQRATDKAKAKETTPQ